MFARYTAALLGTASIMVLAHPSQAVAQLTSQATAAPAALEEVVVTARRREEKAQTVPITITTFTQEQLADQNIRTANDLNKAITAVQLCCNRGAVSFSWIRGIQGVDGYLNGLALSTLTASGLQSGLSGSSLYFDLANVQVLKGPQGTLFGESTDAGAILFETKRPVNDFEGYAEAEVGNYGHVMLDGVLNAPIVADKLLVRVGGEYVKTDGFVHDLSTNKDFYDENYWIGRVQATFRPTDNFENNIFVNYYNFHGNGTTFVWTLVNPTGFAGAIFRNAPFLGLNGQTQTGFINAFNQQLMLGKYGVLGTDAPNNYARTEQWNVQDTATYDINDDLSIKNLIGYQEIISSGWTDTDGTPFAILDGNTRLANGTVLPHTQPTPAVTYADDLQLLGKLLDNKLTVTLGTLNEWKALRSPSYPGYSSTLGSVNGTLSYRSQRTNAVYGQGTIDLSDFVEGLSFTGGYRYTWDKQEFRQDSYAGSTQRLTKSVGLAGWFEGSTYTLSLSYQLNPTTLFYVTDSKGYRTGGFNANAPVGFQEFQPESLDNVEIGVKTDQDILGVKSRLNLAAFYGFYDNIQAQVTSAVPNPNGGPPLLQVLTQNAATAHISGIEAELTIVPVEPLELGADVAYDYNKFDQWQSLNSAGQPQDLSGTPFQENPRWMMRLHGTYTLPIDPSRGKLSFTATWSYQSSQNNTAQLPVLPAYITPGFDDLDLNLDWHDVWGYAGLDASIYGTNVLGNVMTNGPFGVYSALGIFGITPKAPPMWAVRVRYSFGG